MTFTEKKLAEFRELYKRPLVMQTEEGWERSDQREDIEAFLTTTIQEAVDQQHQELRENVKKLRTVKMHHYGTLVSLDQVLALLNQ